MQDLSYVLKIQTAESLVLKIQTAESPVLMHLPCIYWVGKKCLCRKSESLQRNISHFFHILRSCFGVEFSRAGIVLQITNDDGNLTRKLFDLNLLPTVKLGLLIYNELCQSWEETRSSFPLFDYFALTSLPCHL